MSIRDPSSYLCEYAGLVSLFFSLQYINYAGCLSQESSLMTSVAQCLYPDGLKFDRKTRACVCHLKNNNLFPYS